MHHVFEDIHLQIVHVVHVHKFLHVLYYNVWFVWLFDVKHIYSNSLRDISKLPHLVEVTPSELC